MTRSVRCLLLNVWFAGLLSVGCVPTAFKITPVPVDRTLEERELLRDPGWVSDKIALIDITGVIMNARSNKLLSDGEHPVSLLVEKLRAAREDAQVKAAVLRINSPGGSVTASAMMYEEIIRFRRCGKPVVAMMMDVAASGAYYLSCACDEIIAYPTTVTGSIGVIMFSVDLSGTMSKVGVSVDAIKSGENKDAGSPFKAMTPEQREIFQTIISDMFEQFVEVVDKGRPDLDRSRVLELADGRVYTAEQARANGLVDRIGSLRDAIARAKEIAGLEKVRVVTYHRPMTWNPNIYAQTPMPKVDVDLLDLNLPSWLQPGATLFMYLWSP